MDLLDGRPSGKLFVFHPEQDETRVLVDGISFANGVLLSKDESFVLVAESGRFRILRCVCESRSRREGEAARHMACTPNDGG